MCLRTTVLWPCRAGFKIQKNSPSMACLFEIMGDRYLGVSIPLIRNAAMESELDIGQ